MTTEISKRFFSSSNCFPLHSCPVDPFVFPELGHARNTDGLEARFNAFKIPESNFLVFEATVRTCREACQPAYCPSGSGRAETSFGRRKREINETITLETNSTVAVEEEPTMNNDTSIAISKKEAKKVDEEDDKESEYPEFVREMIEVRTLKFPCCFVLCSFLQESSQ